jgi:hypothetical protein
MHRGDLEALTARLAHDLVVHTNQMIAQLRKLRTITLVGASREAILLRSPYPPDRVLIGATAPRATQSLGAVFVFVEEECAFV